MSFEIGEHVLVLPFNRRGKILKVIHDDEREYEYCIKFDTPVQDHFLNVGGTLTKGWFSQHDIRSLKPRTSGFGRFVKEKGL